MLFKAILSQFQIVLLCQQYKYLVSLTSSKEEFQLFYTFYPLWKHVHAPTMIDLVVIPNFRTPDSITTLHTITREITYIILCWFDTETQATECSAWMTENKALLLSSYTHIADQVQVVNSQMHRRPALCGLQVCQSSNHLTVTMLQKEIPYITSSG